MAQLLEIPKNHLNHKLLIMKPPFPLGFIHILPLGKWFRIPPCDG